MARARMIKSEFWSSDQVTSCSRDAQLLFIGLWNFCDDRGVHPASAKRLRMEVFPASLDVTVGMVLDWMRELVAARLVREFEADGDRFWHVIKFAEHQKVRKPYSPHPDPAQYPDAPSPEQDEYSTVTAPVQHQSCNSFPKEKEKSESESEEKSETEEKVTTTSQLGKTGRKPKGNLGGFMAEAGLSKNGSDPPPKPQPVLDSSESGGSSKLLEAQKRLDDRRKELAKQGEAI